MLENGQSQNQSCKENGEKTYRKPLRQSESRLSTQQDAAARTGRVLLGQDEESGCWLFDQAIQKTPTLYHQRRFFAYARRSQRKKAGNSFQQRFRHYRPRERPQVSRLRERRNDCIAP